MAPLGLFCMSGPVAHVDDEDEGPCAVPMEATHVQEGHEEKHRFDDFAVAMGAVSKKRPPTEKTVARFLSDGCLYEGDWNSGQTDRGKIFWPSGSFYEGEVMEGNLHGIGTFTGADGTLYTGHWILNKKHGFGRKRYANGDIYEGQWKWDVPEGKGSYFWSNGSEYVGEWKQGLMCGMGALLWASGDRYDGQWLNGLAHGYGVYRWADGSSYWGAWNHGLKCGDGRLSPASDNEGVNVTNGSFTAPDLVVNSAASSTSRHTECAYDYQMLCHADAISGGVLALNLGDAKRPCKLIIPVKATNFIRHNWFLREKRPAGEAITRGHRNYDLVLNLQSGIKFCVGKVLEDSNRKLSVADFGPKARLKVKFCKEDSTQPPYEPLEFKWKDYCPMVFRKLRETFNISAADFVASICGEGGLREFSTPGKSGSVFYFSQDERFMLKTLRKAEVKVLLRMLPRYYDHLQMHKDTLIAKFFGLYRIQLGGCQKMRFVVMGNVVAPGSWIHQKFDLKGSSQGRFADKLETDGTTTLKDLDLDYLFHLESSLRDALLGQISRDCKFLQSECIMDYSLLLGLHFQIPQPTTFLAQGLCSKLDLPLQDVMISKLLSSNAYVEVEVNSIFAAQGSQRPESMKLSSSISQYVLLGVNMPAKAYRCQENETNSAPQVCDVLLYCGIIDFLQEYGMGKKLEHAYKSMQYDPYSISAVDPNQYSKRFQHFIHQIFPTKI